MDGKTLIEGTRIDRVTALALRPATGPFQLEPIRVAEGYGLPVSVGRVTHLDLDLDASDQYLAGYEGAESRYALVIRRGDQERAFTVDELDELLSAST